MTDHIDRLLAEAAPQPAAEPETLQQAWALVEAELNSDHVVVPLRRSRRRIAVVGAVAAAVALTAAAPFIATQPRPRHDRWIAQPRSPGVHHRLDPTAPSPSLRSPH